MTLDELNQGDAVAVCSQLLRCCGSKRWVDKVLAQRPFKSAEALQECARSLWWTLKESDWLEAFAAHPQIGEAGASRWSSEEQHGIALADSTLLGCLAHGNHEYRTKFGWIFLVNATGKTARDMTAILDTRLQNEPAVELKIAAGEQEQIMKLRLAKLLNE